MRKQSDKAEREVVKQCREQVVGESDEKNQ